MKNKKIVLALISISSCDNSARTQSKWPFITAKCNGVSYIICVIECHKEMKAKTLSETLKSKNFIQNQLNRNWIKKFEIQIVLQLISIPSWARRRSTISTNPFSAANCNKVLFIKKKVKHHELNKRNIKMNRHKSNDWWIDVDYGVF